MIYLYLLPVIVCIIGALVYAISNNGDVKALAKDCFWCGLLVFLLQVAFGK